MHSPILCLVSGRCQFEKKKNHSQKNSVIFMRDRVVGQHFSVVVRKNYTNQFLFLCHFNGTRAPCFVVCFSVASPSTHLLDAYADYQ